SDDVARTLEVFGKPASQPRRAVLIGAGNVGVQVARQLEAERPRIRAIMIERDRIRAETAADSLKRTIVLNGDGLSTELLHEANAPSADTILALTNDDKTNILAALRAKQMGA